ncbi:hypothetical protein ASC65_05590 [Brevundimonas sp. Root1279]|nr:hypothetical protein ASC65_05590 [Brevundimonas sp. Root1279]
MSVFVSIAVASTAAAGIVWISRGSYSTAEEAHRNRAAAPARCLDDSGANACVAGLIAERGREGIMWSPVWATADSVTVCVDGVTAHRTGCDAPGAVRTIHIPPPTPLKSSPTPTP